MEAFKTLVQKTVMRLFNLDCAPIVSRPDAQFGDFATNVAMQITKQVGKAPREVAEMLVAELSKDEHIVSAEVAGPGFINVRVSDTAVKKLLELSSELPQPFKGKVVVAEYSDPNPFKVLHAGHLYTTIVGDAVANVMQAAGATVHRVNFGGDVGLHVGKTMWAILKFFGGEHPEKLDAVDTATRLEWVSARYVEGNEAYEDDEQAKAEIIAHNKHIYELHTANDHESGFAKIYWACRQWSYDGFDKLYEQIQVQPFEKYMPESTVTEQGIAIVQKGLTDGIFEKSDGAVVFKGEEHGLHTRVFINSNGLPTYEAKDLGLAATKWQDYHFDSSFIITANDIVEYMKVILKVLAHSYPEASDRTKHLTHGVIKLPGGVKMSSRKGNILRAVDILDAAHTAQLEISGKEDEQVVLGAVKYAFLKQRIGGDIVYDPNESVSVEGNSGPYLQYAHARAKSILTKVTALPDALGELDSLERTLALKISEYPEVIEKVLIEYMPHYICTYLYELAQEFNRFYEHNRVVGDPREAVRASLITYYTSVLKNGLTLLGITAPDSM